MFVYTELYKISKVSESKNVIIMQYIKQYSLIHAYVAMLKVLEWQLCHLETKPQEMLIR